MTVTEPSSHRIVGQPHNVQGGSRRTLSQGNFLTLEEKDLISRINKTVSLKDMMYAGNPEHYFGVGLSAVRNINEALSRSTAVGAIQSVLDFPCGYGRVLRYLVKQFPQAEVCAAEIDNEAVAYCVKAFGAVGFRSETDFKKISFERKFDLIWCGSLITHLKEKAILELLDFLSGCLNLGGLLMITTHGDFAVKLIEHKPDLYGLSQDAAKSIAESYYHKGYGYTNYPGQNDYGITACSPQWMRSQIQQIGGLQEIYFKAQGWDNHQDVFGLLK
jgi:SAM-dependent methyltransferase